MSTDDLPEGVSVEDAKRVMNRVLYAEQDKLHMQNPSGIINDIEQIIKAEIK